MNNRDAEFAAYFDSLVERCLARICGPARDHFIDPIAKLPVLVRMTNVDDRKLIMASIRRLVRSGRVTRAKQRFAGRSVAGIVCLPRAEWERINLPPASSFRLTESDVAFLESVGVAVDPADVCETVVVE